MFGRWGRFVYRTRWWMLVFSAVLLGLSIGGVVTGGTLAGNGNFGAELPAGKASKLIQQEMRPNQATSAGSEMTLLFGSSTLVATDDAFKSALEQAVAQMQTDPRVTSVYTPYTVPDPSNLMSRDQHHALVEVQLRDKSSDAAKYYHELLAMVHPGPLTVVATGQVPLNDAFNTTLESDVQRGEVVALPIALLVLVLIFASVVAALLPLGVGVLAIVGGVGGTLFLGRFTDVSQYAINVVTLIGLAVAIDYSLFIVSRFRDELALGESREEALAITMATAGRAITFSGITVAIGLSAMLFFQGTFLASMGAAGAIVVGIAVIYGLTFLPALMAVLGPRVDRLRLPWIGRRGPEGTGAWHAMATWVMKRPLVVLVPAVVVLVLAGTPFLQLRLANGDVDVLPPSNAARQGWDILRSDFPGQNQTTITGVVYYPDGSPLTADHVGAIYDLSRRLAALPNVDKVQSIVDVDPSLTRTDYERLYSDPTTQLPAALQQALPLGAGPHIVLIDVVTNKDYTSEDARNLVRDVRAESVPDGQVLATGSTAFDLDVVDFIVQRTPVAVGAVVLVTYIVLFMLTGSVVLPLKAVIIKSIGVGLAIAIAIDATIVRILIVPSVMRILGRANWWAPRPLRWLHDRMGTDEIARPSAQQPAIP